MPTRYNKDMKLKYDLQMMEVDDQIVAVPVGDKASEFHAIINLNKESQQIIELIKQSNTPEEVHEKLCKLYPEDDRNELGQQLCDFLNQLVKEGLLIP